MQIRPTGSLQQLVSLNYFTCKTKHKYAGVLWVRSFRNCYLYGIFFVCGKIWIQNSAFSAVFFLI